MLLVRSLNTNGKGNVRELKNVIERAVYQQGAGEEPIDELVFNPFGNDWSEINSGITEPTELNASSAADIQFPIDYKKWQEEQDLILLNKVLHESKHNQRQAAKMLGLSYHQLRGMLRKYNLVGQQAE